MSESSWHAFEDGNTLGQPGSEEGTIARDEEHDLGARITLERDARVAPFAITCGIYGWMVHTRFFDAEVEAEAEYGQMRSAIAALLEAAEQAAGVDGGRKVLMDGVSGLVERFP